MTKTGKVKKYLSSFSETQQNIFAFSIIGIFALILLRGAFYGVATPDESFYLTIPYRIILGDKLLIDEWHASQLSAFLLYLPMKLFIEIMGKTDGIILYFRCIFVFCQTAVSVYTYQKLKKFGKTPALISALLFLTYVTEQVHMLDYYTMTLMGFQVCTLLFFMSEKLSKPKLIFLGIVFACTVTAQPFNCAVYFIYCLFVLFFTIKRKKREFSDFTKSRLCKETWFFITLGILITAVVFLIFMFSQMSFSELINNIGNLFSGQDHNLPFSKEADSDMFSYLTIAKTLFTLSPVCYIVSLLMMLAVMLDKNRTNHKVFWLIIGITVTFIYTAVLLIVSFSNPSAFLFRPYPLFVLTLTVLMIKKEKNKKLMSIFLMGILYTVFLGIISQALDFVGAIGFVVSNSALIPAVKELITEIKHEDLSYLSKIKVLSDKVKAEKLITVFTGLASVICVSVILTGAILEFSDDIAASSFGRPSEKATITLTSGPLKGIKTNEEMAKTYFSILCDLQEIKNTTNGKVLVAGLIPWTYFYFDTPPAAFTTWYIDNELYMYEKYYEVPEHRPECIYIPSVSFYWAYNYQATANSRSLYFKKMFSGNIEKGEIGTIFYINKMR